MKQLLFYTIFSILFLNSFSQSLEGKWDGSFTAYLPLTTTVNTYYRNNIQLEIILDKDSTYTIYTYSGEPYARGHFADHKCEITYAMLSGDSLIMVETKVVQPENIKTCLKTMNLKIVKRKKYIALEGSWQTNTEDCDNKGEIKFLKKIIEKK